MVFREGLSGFATKTLTQNSIQRHFEDFGLEPQFSTHGKIRGLSGGFIVLFFLYLILKNRTKD